MADPFHDTHTLTYRRTIIVDDDGLPTALSRPSNTPALRFMIDGPWNNWSDPVSDPPARLRPTSRVPTHENVKKKTKQPNNSMKTKKKWKQIDIRRWR